MLKKINCIVYLLLLFLFSPQRVLCQESFNLSPRIDLKIHIPTPYYPSIQSHKISKEKSYLEKQWIRKKIKQKHSERLQNYLFPKNQIFKTEKLEKAIYLPSKYLSQNQFEEKVKQFLKTTFSNERALVSYEHLFWLYQMMEDPALNSKFQKLSEETKYQTVCYFYHCWTMDHPTVKLWKTQQFDATIEKNWLQYLGGELFKSINLNKVVLDFTEQRQQNFIKMKYHFVFSLENTFYKQKMALYDKLSAITLHSGYADQFKEVVEKLNKALNEAENIKNFSSEFRDQMKGIVNEKQYLVDIAIELKELIFKEKQNFKEAQQVEWTNRILLLIEPIVIYENGIEKHNKFIIQTLIDLFRHPDDARENLFIDKIHLFDFMEDINSRFQYQHLNDLIESQKGYVPPFVAQLEDQPNQWTKELFIEMLKEEEVYSREFLRVASALRRRIPYQINKVDKRPNLQYAVEEGMYMQIGRNLYLSPITQSFRRHMVFATEDSGRVVWAIEVMIPGASIGKWVVDGKKRQRIAEDLNHNERKEKIARKVIDYHILKKGSYLLYDEVLSTGKDLDFQMTFFDYPYDGRRLTTIDYEEMRKDLNLELFDLKEHFILDITEKILVIHDKGYAGNRTRQYFDVLFNGSDAHLENYFVYFKPEDLFPSIEQVSDFQAFEKQQDYPDRKGLNDFQLKDIKRLLYGSDNIPGLKKIFNLSDYETEKLYINIQISFQTRKDKKTSFYRDLKNVLPQQFWNLEYYHSQAITEATMFLYDAEGYFSGKISHVCIETARIGYPVSLDEVKLFFFENSFKQQVSFSESKVGLENRIAIIFAMNNLNLFRSPMREVILPFKNFTKSFQNIRYLIGTKHYQHYFQNDSEKVIFSRAA